MKDAPVRQATDKVLIALLSLKCIPIIKLIILLSLGFSFLWFSFLLPEAEALSFFFSTSKLEQYDIYNNRHKHKLHHREWYSSSGSDAEKFMDEEEPTELSLSSSDLQRLAEMRDRYKIIPILILDAMLPGQCLDFRSNDPKFFALIDYVLDNNELNAVEVRRVIGMIGVNPNTGKPLNLGVTLNLDEHCVRKEDDSLRISVKGSRRFQVQGNPWFDETESFYLAEIEFIENREESLSAVETQEACKLSDALPDLIDRWLGWVIQTGASDQAGMDSRLKDIGPMPDEVGARAIWTAAMINPLPALGVCLEIRPAMLACKNDLDRVRLAVAAIRSSIDHLSGRRRLF